MSCSKMKNILLRQKPVHLSSRRGEVPLRVLVQAPGWGRAYWKVNTADFISAVPFGSSLALFWVTPLKCFTLCSLCYCYCFLYIDTPISVVMPSLAMRWSDHNFSCIMLTPYNVKGCVSYMVTRCPWRLRAEAGTLLLAIFTCTVLEWKK